MQDRCRAATPKGVAAAAGSGHGAMPSWAPPRAVDGRGPGAISRGERMATARDERWVLICDDEVRLGKLTAGLLTQSGYMAKTVSDGQQALRTLETDSGCGALLLDVNLPGLSARELLARMRASGLHQPVILTSGYPEEDVAPELMRDPMVKAYL